ncbi:MBL fold metallo-hydrolase [Cellulomonas triticagri]|uniref:MBL fold metallo-hydrolase n=1 Tax=Cellulomonas triticagri TaxID=2483352 RepID=A0A3M2IWI7_9CELL|nr:MBL fold metallo-hydrolase [Cellulomonas triticagri]RMI04804.1 MBL fold metallo-hydrolase [Cellulomonas triticagri]
MTDGAVLRWLGHASVVLDVGGVRLLTDPLLRPHAGLLRRRSGPPRREHWAEPDAVLLSHLHHDHAELGSLRLLGDAPVLSAPANAHWLARRGVRGAVGVVEGEWWPVPGSSVRVRPVPADHGHRPMPHRPNAAHGFLVAAPGLVVWFAGDTAPYAGMRHLPDVVGARVDVALVPVGGWGPRLSGGHMDPVQAAEACEAVGARWAVPVHWGTLHAPASRGLPPGWIDRAGPAFARALARRGEVEPVVLEPGESVRLDALPGRRRA